MPKSAGTKIVRGSNNIFADLGLPDADTHLLKAQLVVRVVDIIQNRKLSQTEAAQIIGLSQPDVSRMLKGHFREVSVERIMRMLTRLGCTIDIVIKQPGRQRSTSIIRVAKPNSVAG